MAGDWIPVRETLPRAAEVIRLCGLTSRDRHQVIGLLVDFWTWVGHETADGNLPNVTLLTLGVAIGGDEKFWSAVVDVGWLVVTETGITIPNWDVWMGGSARARLQGNRRVAQHRKRECNGPALPERYSGVTKPLPEVEREGESQKRTAQKRKTKDRKQAAPPAAQSAPGSLFADQGGATAKRGGESRPEGGQGPATGRPAAASQPPLMEFPVADDDGTWPVTCEFAQEMRAVYPELDIEHEFRKALSWAHDDLRHRKTRAGMRAFFRNWLTRARNDLRAKGGTAAAAPDDYTLTDED